MPVIKRDCAHPRWELVVLSDILGRQDSGNQKSLGKKLLQRRRVHDPIICGLIEVSVINFQLSLIDSFSAEPLTAPSLHSLLRVSSLQDSQCPQEMWKCLMSPMLVWAALQPPQQLVLHHLTPTFFGNELCSDSWLVPRAVFNSGKE